MSVADKLGLGPKREVVIHEDGSATVTVTAPLLFNPQGRSVVVELTAKQFEGYKAWRRGGVLIQHALSDLSPIARERLMNGLADD